MVSLFSPAAKPSDTARISRACFQSGRGAYRRWQRAAIIRSPAERTARVLSSRSEPNWEKVLSSRYWARSMRRREETCFIKGVWAAEPTRETESPTFTAGRCPALNRSVSRKICPSVMEITLVGM